MRGTIIADESPFLLTHGKRCFLYFYPLTRMKRFAPRCAVTIYNRRRFALVGASDPTAPGSSIHPRPQEDRQQYARAYRPSPAAVVAHIAYVYPRSIRRCRKTLPALATKSDANTQTRASARTYSSSTSRKSPIAHVRSSNQRADQITLVDAVPTHCESVHDMTHRSAYKIGT